MYFDKLTQAEKFFGIYLIFETISSDSDMDNPPWTCCFDSPNN